MSVSIFLIFQKVEIADLVVDGTDGETSHYNCVIFGEYIRSLMKIKIICMLDITLPYAPIGT